MTNSTLLTRATPFCKIERTRAQHKGHLDLNKRRLAKSGGPCYGESPGICHDITGLGSENIKKEIKSEEAEGEEDGAVKSPINILDDTWHTERIEKPQNITIYERSDSVACSIITGHDRC